MSVPLLRLDDVMAELGIGRTKVHALIWSGELPVVRIGRAIRVRRADLDDFIHANLSRRSAPGPDPGSDRRLDDHGRSREDGCPLTPWRVPHPSRLPLSLKGASRHHRT
jgi:excisionase family DNA binding protein